MSVKDFNHAGGYLCVICGTSCINSRQTKTGTTRRRECKNKHRFSTKEIEVEFIDNLLQEIEQLKQDIRIVSNNYMVLQRVLHNAPLKNENKNKMV